ncbi:MAG: hypothetical protein EXR71_07185 [Myxococcales bacterium]|nr:hypothetical protein [Myxococcales bacterium]
MLLSAIAFACATFDDSAPADTAAFADSDSPLVATLVAEDDARPSCPIVKAIPVSDAPAPAVAARPDVDGWLRVHGELRFLAQHRMVAGETAWAIAQDIGAPLWVLRELNPHQDLDRLLVGDWLVFPITNTNVERASPWYTAEQCGC